MFVQWRKCPTSSGAAPRWCRPGSSRGKRRRRARRDGGVWMSAIVVGYDAQRGAGRRSTPPSCSARHSATRSSSSSATRRRDLGRRDRRTRGGDRGARREADGRGEGARRNPGRRGRGRWSPSAAAAALIEVADERDARIRRRQLRRAGAEGGDPRLDSVQAPAPGGTAGSGGAGGGITGKRVGGRETQGNEQQKDAERRAGGVTKRFGELVAVDDLSLDARRRGSSSPCSARAAAARRRR